MPAEVAVHKGGAESCTFKPLKRTLRVFVSSARGSENGANSLGRVVQSEAVVARDSVKVNQPAGVMDTDAVFEGAAVVEGEAVAEAVDEGTAVAVEDGGAVDVVEGAGVADTDGTAV